MSRPLRILYYNWVDYLDAEGRGGGVSVYQRNLMRQIDAGAGAGAAEAVFLSSGVAHDLPAAAPRWETVRHGPADDRARRFEIVNSGVLAPAHHSFGDPAQLSHPQTEAAFFDFVDKIGPFDVVHFNNLEGLPVSVLGLRTRWPGTRVILSLHNYYPVCPQVNLWHQERALCSDFEGGRKCVDCLPYRHNRRIHRLAGGLAYRLKRAGLTPGTRAFDTVFRWTLRIGGRASRALSWTRRRLRGGKASTAPGAPAGHAAFAERRARMVDTINAHCDAVLCVSGAVRKLALHYGLDPAITHTSYIGTREAEAFERTAPHPGRAGGAGTLTLAYLGYMRRDKGFFFLLDALEALPGDIAARLHLVIAARALDPATMARIGKLGQRLGGLRHEDGYAHDDLDRLLAGVDVGLVPVLWHDNLPQVAIEMHARHIPLLTSDLGGAQELGRCADMVFRAGDKADFEARIRALLEDRVDMTAYWQGAMAPVGMGAHMTELLGHYTGRC